MTLRNNIMAILESYFSGYKEELITNATDRIMAQVERQKPEKIFIEGIEYKRADTPQKDCPKMTEEEFDTMLAKVLVGQTDSTGSPIGDYRDGVGAWQTDCGWGEPNE